MAAEGDLDIPFEIKCAIIEEVEDAYIGKVALIWPDMLPFIRLRTFGSVVLAHHANHSPDADLTVACQRVQNSLDNLHNVLSHTPEIAEYIRLLHLRDPMPLAETSRPLLISQHPILSQFLRHIPEMTNLQHLILERLNFWHMSDPTTFPRALRHCTFSLDTLQIKNCIMSMDLLVAILHALADVRFVDFSNLRFDNYIRLDYCDVRLTGDPVLVDYDDRDMDKKRLKPNKEPEKEFLCVDTLRMYLIGDDDHYFVDFLKSERHSPLRYVRVLEIECMSGDKNLFTRLNELLARTSSYLEELSIFRAGMKFNDEYLHSDSYIHLAHLSTFRFWMRILYYRCLELEGIPAWSVEEQRYATVYIRSLKRIAETSKLRELELSLVIDVITTNVMPDMERHFWRDLDEALTTKNLDKTLEVLVLKVYLNPLNPKDSRLSQCCEITEQYMAGFEDWILAVHLPATRRTYFERDKRGVLFCNDVRQMSKGASNDGELSRLVELCSPNAIRSGRCLPRL